jgi:hypothetical protein
VAEKIDAQSRSKRGEKGASTRLSLAYRIAVDLLFATKMFDRVVGGAKELPSKQQIGVQFPVGL